MSELMKDLEWRGLIAQSTNADDLRAWLESGPKAIYCGFDPSAPSLHMGNLVPLLTLARFQQAGHRPIGLVGGATGLIGDPSGRNSERQLNPADVVADWVSRLEHQVGKFLSFENGPAQATLISNLEWTSEISALDFLRDIGKHFPVGRMVSREAVSARLEDQGLSFTEFSYQVLQANDYLELNRRFDCSLQIGGSDQWGNITAGCDLIRRVTGIRAHGLTLPLVTKADGTKFGKTAGGAVWLDPAMTTPEAFYKFWLNTDHHDVVRFLKIFSFRSREDIEALAETVRSAPETRLAQIALANDFTELVHGPERLAEAKAAQSMD